MQKCAAAFTAFRAVKAALEVKIIIHFKEVSLVSSQRTPTQVHSLFYHIIQDMSNTPEGGERIVRPGRLMVEYRSGNRETPETE